VKRGMGVRVIVSGDYNSYVVIYSKHQEFLFRYVVLCLHGCRSPETETGVNFVNIMTRVSMMNHGSNERRLLPHIFTSPELQEH
jgi:hypothetical protein